MIITIESLQLTVAELRKKILTETNQIAQYEAELKHAEAYLHCVLAANKALGESEVNEMPDKFVIEPTPGIVPSFMSKQASPLVQPSTERCTPFEKSWFVTGLKFKVYLYEDELYVYLKDIRSLRPTVNQSKVKALRESGVITTYYIHPFALKSYSHKESEIAFTIDGAISAIKCSDSHDKEINILNRVKNLNLN